MTKLNINHEQFYKRFVPYSESNELKDLGFNGFCFGEYRQWENCEPYLQIYQMEFDHGGTLYNKVCLAPIWQDAFDFFRYEYDLDSYTVRWGNKKFTWEAEGGAESIGEFDNIYDARLDCIKYLIKVVKGR